MVTGISCGGAVTSSVVAELSFAIVEDGVEGVDAIGVIVVSDAVVE